MLHYSRVSVCQPVKSSHEDAVTNWVCMLILEHWMSATWSAKAQSKQPLAQTLCTEPTRRHFADGEKWNREISCIVKHVSWCANRHWRQWSVHCLLMMLHTLNFSLFLMQIQLLSCSLSLLVLSTGQSMPCRARKHGFEFYLLYCQICSRNSPLFYANKCTSLWQKATKVEA